MRAHIRRHDYLVSLFQSAMETVLFYHPAVWWVSNQIRREREHCCDDIAVAICGDRLAYAKALTFLEERRSPVPAGAFGATGGVLKIRIARLLGLYQPPVFPRTPAAVLLVFAAATAGFTVWGSARAQAASPQQGTMSNQSSSAKSPISSQSAVPPAGTPVHVRSLTIDSNDLPESDRLQIVQAYQEGTYPLQELMERIRQNVRDRGYAKATVEFLQPESAPASQPPYSMDISVRVSAGTQYTLSGFSIEGAQALSQNEIIQQFPFHPGDLFNATAIGKGLDRLNKLYQSKGYANFAAIPRLQMDDVCHTIILILDINELGLARGQEVSHVKRLQVDVLSDTRGVDLGPYVRNGIFSLESHWSSSAQKIGNQSAGDVEAPIISFTILPNGRTTSVRLEHGSGDVKLDRAACTAITSTDFSPLPPTLDSPLTLRVTF